MILDQINRNLVVCTNQARLSSVTLQMQWQITFADNQVLITTIPKYKVQNTLSVVSVLQFDGIAHSETTKKIL